MPSPEQPSYPYPYLAGYDPQSSPYVSLPVATNDPFNARIQQFATLRTLGYPVMFDQIDRYTAREIYTAMYNKKDRDLPDHIIPEFQGNRRWCLLRVTDLDFKPWSDLYAAFDDSDALAHTTTSQLQTLENHPGCDLPLWVDHGGYLEVLKYIRRNQGVRPVTANPNSRFGGTIIGCYLRAVDRRMIALQPAEEIRRQTDTAIPNPQELKLYDDFKQQGHVAATSEAIGALIQDYYLLLEQYVPEFAAFKKSAE